VNRSSRSWRTVVQTTRPHYCDLSGTLPRVRNRALRLRLLVPGALAAAALLLSCVTPVVRPMRPAPNLSERGISAHRGGGKTHPENTLAAFHNAIARRVHQIELDVRQAADGVLVLMHDETVDRTTDGSGRVSDLTLAEIQVLDAGSWKDPMFAGERVPTFREALQIMPSNMWINVDVKGDAEVAKKATQVVCEEQRLHQAVFHVRDGGREAVKAVHDDAWIGNMNRGVFRGCYVDRTIEHGDEFIQFYQLRLRPRASTIEKLEAAGVRSNYCCTDSEDSLRRLFEVGVRFPFVNDLEPAVQLAEELGFPRLVPEYGPRPACTLGDK
jgi:hypothetical protein